VPQTEKPAAASPRERILAAARQVFAARGFRGGSLNDVAVLAGYTRAGLLHHFPSKESILLALLEERDRHLDDLIPSGSEEGIIDLMNRLTGTTDFVLRDRELVQLAHVLTAEASGGEHPARLWVTRRQARLRDSLARALRHSIATGEFPDTVDADVFASVIYGMFEGLEAQWLLDPAVDPLAGHEAMLALLDKNVSKNPTNQ
jgi:AcrR family transcriptional regulator